MDFIGAAVHICSGLLLCWLMSKVKIGDSGRDFIPKTRMKEGEWVLTMKGRGGGLN